MGTHPIFESDFDCLTDCFCSEKKCFPVLLAQLLSKSKRESSTQFSSGVLFHFWKKSSLDHHWHVLFTQSCQPLWGLFQKIVMVFDLYNLSGFFLSEGQFCIFFSKLVRDIDLILFL